MPLFSAPVSHSSAQPKILGNKLIAAAHIRRITFSSNGSHTQPTILPFHSTYPIHTKSTQNHNSHSRYLDIYAMQLKSAQTPTRQNLICLQQNQPRALHWRCDPNKRDENIIIVLDSKKMTIKCELTTNYIKASITELDELREVLMLEPQDHLGSGRN